MGGNGPVACSHVKNDYMVDVIVEHITNARRSSGSSASWFARQMKRGQIIRFKNQRPSLKNYRAMCGISIAWGPVAEIEPSTTSLVINNVELVFYLFPFYIRFQMNLKKKFNIAGRTITPLSEFG